MQATRRTPNASLTNVPSFRPELEFEIIKAVLLRESYIKRLEKTLKANGGKVDITVVGLVDVLRECSLEIVDVIQTWERTQFGYPKEVKPFLWNGANYLRKMCSDNASLSQYTEVADWLGFSPECNPFFIPPEALEGTVSLKANAFVVFGFRPPPPPEVPRAKAIMPKFVKSPYLTPIHNDLDIFPQNSAVNKAKKNDKLRAAAQAAADEKQAVGKDRAKDAPTDPYQCFLHADAILRAKKMLSVLVKANDNAPLFDTTGLGSTYTPSSSFVTATDLPSSVLPPGPGSPAKLNGSLSAGGASASTLPPVPTIGAKSTVAFQGQLQGQGQGQGQGHALGSNLEEGSFDVIDSLEPAQGQEQISANPPVNGEQPRPQRERSLSPTRTQQPSASSPNKQSLTATVGNTGSYAGRLGSTSIFSQNREDFETTQDGFRQSLQASADDAPVPNKAMRMVPIVDQSTATKQSAMAFTSALDSASSATMSGTTNASQVWTPHEITLQRAVRRRGGELFVLTAAATKGRIKAPTRRTRFERLQKDLVQFDLQARAVEEQIASETAALEAFKATTLSTSKPSKKLQKKLEGQEESLNNLIESKRGIESWKITLLDQFTNYKMVSELDPADLEKQRQMHNRLQDGQALEEDEKLSMRLEDRMADRLIRFIRRCVGRQLRAAEWKRRHAAASAIQGLVRRKANEGLAYQRGIRVTLAMKVQKLARGAGGKGAAKAMDREQRRRAAVLLLIRVARGSIARQRTRRKRLFMRSVAEARRDVSIDCLIPERIDALADLLEAYSKDYTVSIPIQVMTVLRGILYMMIGDGMETVTVDNAGFVEHFSITADTAGWNSLRLILRRKGRFLRRLRSMVNWISIPGPRALDFTADTVTHMQCVVDNIKPQHFSGIDRKNRETVTHLYDFIVHLKTAYNFQAEFPEYFVPGTPYWFRLMMRFQRNYQDDMADLSMFKYCKRQIDVMRDDFKAKGKAWKAVQLAADTNAQDIADAEARSEANLERYNWQVKAFEGEEAIKLSIIRGFMKTREIGVVVAERDWTAFVEKEGDDAPEERISIQRLLVDKAHLDLLESRNKIFFAEKMKLRDERARDFKKHLQLQESRKICKEEGRLLGKLMVLQYVWEDFVSSIGGIQYIYDLKGEQKTYFEETRAEVTYALTERRRLKALRDKELTWQFTRVANLAHEARMGEYTSTWDVRTDMEIEAEEKEDLDCRARDADQDAKIARATKRLKIPPADFKPLMLLIDTRVPKKIKEIVKMRLEPLHFQEVHGDLSDPTLTLRLQKLMDTKWNIFVFADRGTNLQARTAFLGYFRSLLYSLIPRPRVVALDAFLELRYDNWFLETAASQADIFKYNVCNSTEASLLLSRLRKTALIFKQCLIFESKQEEINAGCQAIVPEWLRKVFRDDLDDFMQELEGRKVLATGSVMSAGNELDNAGMILAATISATLGWWNAPLLKWRARQIRDGCDAFMERIADATQMCELLWMRRFPRTQIKQLECLKQSRSFVNVWKKIIKNNFYKQPARYLLSRWVLEAMDLVEGITMQGGGADERIDNCGVSYVRNLRWKDDIADPETVANQLVGELLHECLSESLIYTCNATVSEYRPVTDVDDIEKQFFAASSVERTVRVYHSGTRAFVGVAVPNMPGENSVWQYFNQMDIVDIVSMLQPNGTELYEGTAERHDIGEEGDEKWWQLVAQWCRMDVIGKNRNLELLRCRYLMLTKVGTVNGHVCRLELFEERYAEILILVHGLPGGTGTVYFRINKARIAHLLEFCDKHVERQSIQMREALSIAYIFSDRLQAKPSLNQLWWLENGTLDPKSLARKRPVTVSVRIRGGPGRFVGRKMFSHCGMILLISVFEVSNPSDIPALRIIIYDCTHCQTVEVRLSEMERMELFNDDSAMIDQIVGRMRVVRTDVRGNRPLILLESSFHPKSGTYSCEGDQEYVLMDDVALEYSREHADSDGDSDDSHSKKDADGKDMASLKSEDDSQIAELNKIKRGYEEAEELENAKLFAASRARPWYWCTYFSRTVLEVAFGNLTVSAGLNTTNHGFDVYVLDNRTQYEKYTFLPYETAIKYLYKTTIDAFRRRLRTVNETTVFEMVDELFSVMELEPSEDNDGVNVHILGLHSENENVPPLALAYVRELEEDEMSVEDRKFNIKTAKLELTKVEIQVLAARDLALVSGLQARNPTAIIKWNMRELGRTIAPRNDCNPDWDEPGIQTSSTGDKALRDCALEIEVWDYNFQKAKITEFLGCVRLRNDQLIDFFDKGSKKQLLTLPLQRSNRLNDKENMFVQGSIVLFGLYEQHWGKIEAPASYRLTDNDAERKALEYKIAKEKKEFEKSQAPKSGWGWGKKESAEPATPKPATPSSSAPAAGISESPLGGETVGTLDARNSVSFDPTVTVGVRHVDRSIRFSLRHKRSVPLTPHLAGTSASDALMILAVQSAATAAAGRHRNRRAIADNGQSPGDVGGDGDRDGEGAGDFSPSRMSAPIINHFPEIESLGDEELDNQESLGGEGADGGASVDDSVLSGSVGEVPGLGLPVIVTNDFDDESHAPQTARSVAITDDTLSLAGGSEHGAELDSTPPLTLTVKFLQLEGVPHETAAVTAVIKFNGFEAGRSDSVACMKTVIELEDGSMGLAMGDDRNRQDIINQMAWDETKSARGDEKTVSSTLSKKKAKEVDSDGDTVDENADMDSSLVDTHAESNALSLNEKDEDSFVSLDRRPVIQDDVSVESSVRTYRIPDRIRRSDVNNIAIFPTGTSFNMTVPTFLDLNSCSVELELWDSDALELLGVIDLRGSKLRTFIQEQGFAKQWLEFHDTYSGSTSEFENTCGDMVPLRMMVSATDNTIPTDPDYVPPRDKLLSLRLKQLKFIPSDFIPVVEEEELDELASYNSDIETHKQKVFDDTGVFVEILWNGEVVHTSKIVHGSTGGQLAVEFGEFEEWQMTLDKDTDIAKCRLELKMYSKDGRIFHGAGPPPRLKPDGDDAEDSIAKVDRTEDSDDEEGKGTDPNFRGASKSLSSAQQLSERSSKGQSTSSRYGIDIDDILSPESLEKQTAEEALAVAAKAAEEEAAHQASLKEKAERELRAVRFLGVRAVTGNELDKLFQLLPEETVEVSVDAAVESRARKDDTPPALMSPLNDKSDQINDSPEAGQLKWSLNLKARFLEDEPIEPNQDEEPEEWSDWKTAKKIRDNELRKARNCEIDIFSRELFDASNPPRPDPVTVVAGWTSHAQAQSAQPGAGKSPPPSAMKTGGGRPGTNPRLNSTGFRGSTGRPGSTGGRPGTNPRPGSSGVNMAVSPALFQGGLTLDGFNFEGAPVNMFRQNAMAEAQDMPQRKVFLMLSSIVVQGPKPRAFSAFLSGWGGWGSSSTAAVAAVPTPAPAPAAAKEVDKAATAAEKKVESVQLTLSRGRESQGVNFLMRYIDCANYIGRKQVLNGESSEADAAMAGSAAADAKAEETVMEKPVYAPGIKYKPREASIRRRTSLSSRSGSVLIMQRKATFTSLKRARLATSSILSPSLENTAEGNAEDDQQGRGGKRPRSETMTSRVTQASKNSGTLGSRASAGGAGRDASASDAQSASKDAAAETMPSEANNEGSAEVKTDAVVEIDKDAFRQVQVFFNGAFIHEMLVPIKYTESAATDEPAAELDLHDFKIPLFVPRGQRLDACRLEIVIFSITPQSKKDRVVGLRIFEGDELLDVFDHQINPLSSKSPSRSAQVKDAKSGSAGGEQEGNIREMLISPRVGDLRVYDMEVPGTFNNGNADGVAIATEKVALCGGAEVDYEDMTSGLNLGVRVHSRQRGLQSRERGAQATRRKVEVRLLAAKGLLATAAASAARNPTGAAPFSKASVPKSGFSSGEAKSNGAADFDNADDMSVLTGNTRAHAEDSLGVGLDASVDKGADANSIENTFPEPNDTDEVYAVVRWNGQEIRQSHPMPIASVVVWADGNPLHDMANLDSKEKLAQDAELQRSHQSAPVVDPLASSTFTMFVPVGHRLRGCYLEVALMQGDLCLGSTCLHGEDLESFLQGYGSVTDDAAFYENYDVDDPVITSMRSYPLQYSPGIPREVQPKHLNGRLVLRGRVEREAANDENSRPKTTTNPFDTQQDRQFHGSVNIKKKTHDVNMFRIKTRIAGDNPGWRYFHDKALEKLVIMDEAKQSAKAEADKKKQAALARFTDQRQNLVSVRKVGHLSEGASVDAAGAESSGVESGAEHDVANGNSLTVTDASQEMSHSEILAGGKTTHADNIVSRAVVSAAAAPAPTPAPAAEISKLSYGLVDQRTGRNIPKPFNLPMERFKLELSAIKYVQVNEELQEDCRICWRGRAMPKNFKGTKGADMTQNMMMSRSSRLVRNKPLKDMKLLSEVHFLKDLGNAKQATLNALPISVKEIITSGPGLCARVYRIEISTNSGQPIGQADISNDLEMIKAVGAKNADRFGEEGRKGWKMPELFAFVVNERTEIDFMPTERVNVVSKKAKGKDVQRRAGLSVGKKNGMEKAPNSVINIMQDDVVNPEVRFRATYGPNFPQEENAYDDDEMRAEMLRQTQRLTAANLAAVAAKNPLKGGKGIKSGAAGEPITGAIAEEDSDADWSVSDSQESAEPQETEEEVRKKNVPWQYLRIYSKTHRMSGITFKSIIMFAGRIENLFTEPNEYFSRKTLQEGLADVKLMFRCKDTFSAITHELEFFGAEIIDWLALIPTAPKDDLSTKFRRAKFGEFILKNLIMRFSRKGEFILDLVNEEIGQLNASMAAADDDGADDAAAYKSTAQKREERLAELAAAKAVRKGERRRIKIAKLRVLRAEKARLEAIKKAEEEEAAREKAKAFSGAGAASAAVDALANAGAAAKAMLGKLKFW